jgi:hypothetical protein
MTRASYGIGAFGPTASIRPLRMMILPRGISTPGRTTIRASTMAIVPVASGMSSAFRPPFWAAAEDARSRKAVMTARR